MSICMSMVRPVCSSFVNLYTIIDLSTGKDYRHLPDLDLFRTTLELWPKLGIILVWAGPTRN